MLIAPCGGCLVRCYFLTWPGSTGFHITQMTPAGPISDLGLEAGMPVLNGTCGDVGSICTQLAPGYCINPTVGIANPLVISNETASPNYKYWVWSDRGYIGARITVPTQLPSPPVNAPMISPAGTVSLWDFGTRTINGGDRVGVRVYLGGGSTGFAAGLDLYWECSPCV